MIKKNTGNETDGNEGQAKKESDDYDSPWKEVIECYFKEFIEFFFPEAYRDIDWDMGYEFLNKELRQITKDAEAGRKYVDKLVRVWLKSGQDIWALIHTEIQSQPDDDLPERMYTYNYRLFDLYRIHAASFAVIGYSRKKKESQTFQKKLWRCEIRFTFPVVKLSDYAKDWKALEQSSNPFAVVVMTHLMTKKTSGKPGKRKHEKLTLIKHLYSRGFSKQDIINLFRFIDWIMHLPEKEDSLFWQELETHEKENKMPYITSVERIGYKRGVQERVQKEKMLIATQIAKKFGSKAEKELTHIQNLDADALFEIGENIFEFNSLKEVHDWIIKRADS